MEAGNLSFDHVHLISEDPQAAALWFVEMLEGVIEKNEEVRGAPQIYLRVGGAGIVVRGRRPGEQVGKKGGLQWGADHFGFNVSKDFDGFCDRLLQKGVRFTLAPTQFAPALRIAFIEGPDGAIIELLHRA